MTASNTTRLFLGPVPDDFSPGQDVAIGPWCFLGREDQFDSWRELPFPAPFDDVAEQTRETHRCHRLYEQVLARQVADFATRHPDTPAVYWERMLGPWVLVTICMAWSRYRVLERFIASRPDRPFTAWVVSSDQEFAFASMAEFIRIIMESALFHHWLVSRLAEALAPAQLTLSELPRTMQDWAPASPNPARPPAQGLRQRVKGWVDRAVAPLSGAGFPQRAILAACLYLLPRRPPDQTPTRPPLVDDLQFPQAFLDVLPRLLERTLPVSLRIPPAGQKIGRPWLRIRYPDCWSDEQRRDDALAIDQGVRIVATQHGSHYGIAMPYSRAPQWEYGADAFLTWGWTAHGPYAGRRFIPLPAPALSRLMNRHHETEATALVIGTACCMQLDGFLWPETGSTILAYLRDKERLVGTLRGAKIPLAYRPFLFDRQTSRIEDWFSRRNPDLPLVTGPLWQKALGCRLLILDHYSTPFHEALAANIPTIALWGAQATGVGPEARPLLDRLRACGILFDTPDAAAAAAARIWPDVQAWWRAPDVQAARRAFCHSHARASRWWFFAWLQKCPGI